MQSLWPDTFVEESNLTQNISQLRRALGDGAAEAQYIETIPKRGYRFVAGVQPLAVNGVSAEETVAVNGHAPVAAGAGLMLVESEQTPPLDAEVATEKSVRKRFLAVAALIGSSLAIVVFALFVAHRRSGNNSALAFQNITLIKHTTSGKASYPAISHDGKFVAHVVEEGDLQSLWVSQVAVNGGVQVVAPAEVVFIGVTFSPDGNLIYYVARPKSERLGKLYQVTLLGGAPREVVSDVDSPITFSPNGQYFAFVRNIPSRLETDLIVAKQNGSEERKLLTRKGPEDLSVDGPSWSPDGRVIACGTRAIEQGKFFMRLLAVRVEDGSSEPIGSQMWSFIGQVAWLGDGSGVVFSAWQMSWGVYGDQLWMLTFPEGEARRVTNDMNSYEGVSISANSVEPTTPPLLITLRTARVSSIWIAPLSSGGFDTTHAAQIRSGFGDNDSERFGLDWTPDGRLVYASQASGNVDVWIATADGKQQRQLTRDLLTDTTPVVTPDGRHIVFTSDRAGSRNIWRMEIDGGGLKQLTRKVFDVSPSLSPDGRWIVYSSSSGGESSLWKVSIDGGEPEQLSSALAGRPVVSPDGKSIAGLFQDKKDGIFKIALLPFAGGEPAFVEGVDRLDFSSHRWSPDGRALTYIATRQGVSNIWSKPIDGGPARQLTSFTSDRIFRYAWSRDGKSLACERGMIINDAVLISGRRSD